MFTSSAFINQPNSDDKCVIPKSPYLHNILSGTFNLTRPVIDMKYSKYKIIIKTKQIKFLPTSILIPLFEGEEQINEIFQYTVFTAVFALAKDIL